VLSGAAPFAFLTVGHGVPIVLCCGHTQTSDSFCPRQFHLSRPIEGKSSMALRSKTLTKSPEPEETVQETVSQRRRPEAGQFLLQVDRQTKASFVSFEAAEKAGLVIKKNFPVVRVAVYDSITGVNKILELPAA